MKIDAKQRRKSQMVNEETSRAQHFKGKGFCFHTKKFKLAKVMQDLARLDLKKTSSDLQTKFRFQLFLLKKLKVIKYFPNYVKVVLDEIKG